MSGGGRGGNLGSASTTRSASTRALAIARRGRFTKKAADKGFDIDDLRSRLVKPAVAQIAIGADIAIGGATP